MELGKFSLEELLLAAIKSEVEAQKIYHGLARQVKDAILKDRLEFLAGEEEKHRECLTEIYRETFPDKELELPEHSPVPLPAIEVEGEKAKLSEILASAMEAELAAREFYKGLSERFEDRPEVREMLITLSEMEKLHYEILKTEKERAEKTEDAEID